MNETHLFDGICNLSWAKLRLWVIYCFYQSKSYGLTFFRWFTSSFPQLKSEFIISLHIHINNMSNTMRTREYGRRDRGGRQELHIEIKRWQLWAACTQRTEEDWKSKLINPLVLLLIYESFKCLVTIICILLLPLALYDSMFDVDIDIGRLLTPIRSLEHELVNFAHSFTHLYIF